MSAPAESEATTTAASATADAAVTVDDADAQDDEQKNSQTVSDLKKVVATKVTDQGKTKSVWTMTLETFGMADGGKKGADDVIVTSLEDSLKGIQTMLEEVQDDAPMWQFTLTPFEELKATKEDMLKAFCMWSKKDDSNNEEGSTYNVSKAFRRLESYAKWMEEHRSVLEKPLTVESIRHAANAYGMKITHSSTTQALCWWIDMGVIDRKQVKSVIPLDDSLRYFVWLSHVVMLDQKAQENGMVFIESMGHKGMMETFTFIPMDLGTKLDRLTIGVLPIKLKICYIFNNLRWMGIMMAMIKPFISKKMRQRIVTIPKTSEPQVILDEAIGRDAIPLDFAGLEGSVEKDVTATYIDG